ncbi:hypothetical protein D8682_05900 [Buttiauxella sp. 3AFRM03]|nr:hypothetical protein D8682_05900 [Buttiauxella sp. 3AFRM03]
MSIVFYAAMFCSSFITMIVVGVLIDRRFDREFSTIKSIKENVIFAAKVSTTIIAASTVFIITFALIEFFLK